MCRRGSRFDKRGGAAVMKEVITYKIEQYILKKALSGWRIRIGDVLFIDI